jgi:hypothetical protein
VPPVSAAEIAAQKSNSFDQARSNLYTTIGTTSDTLSHDTIQALPQGTNAPIEKVLLQAPGVTQDSAAAGFLHVRNDHANVQYRINGVMLPDGVSGFASILDTNFIGSLSLITGALPAEFGLRTVGLVDITTRNDIFNNSGSINYYFGSRETIRPSFEYGGTFGGNCPSASAPVGGKGGAVVNLLWRRAIFLHRQLSAELARHRKSAADAQRDPRLHAAGERLRLSLDLSRSLYAPKPDCRHFHRQFPNSE